MKIILTRDVSNLGQAGDVKDVAAGYARNYLIPQGLAVKATSGALKDLRGAEWESLFGFAKVEVHADSRPVGNRHETVRIDLEGLRQQLREQRAVSLAELKDRTVRDSRRPLKTCGEEDRRAPHMRDALQVRGLGKRDDTTCRRKTADDV